MRLVTSIILVLLIFSFEGIAQKKKSKAKAKNTEQRSQPSSIDAFAPEQNYAPAQKKVKRGKKITYDGRENFYKRMELVAKQKRYAEKQMMKPQYSDPSYFGHKKPPKRRPRGKLKYCKECGIRH